MQILQPDTWAGALQLAAAHPDATPLAGGTDVMVALNFARARPQAILDLGRVAELREWSLDGRSLRIGAGVTYARIVDELGARLPGLAMASRTVGSPQIRNRATVAGNLGTASPAGDALPLLYACDAEVELASIEGTRRLPVQAFVTGPKRTALRQSELIAAVHVPLAQGPQQFSKVGTRNAMVIAICSVGLALSVERRAVAACIGSAGPTPIRAMEAEAFAAAAIEEHDLWASRGPLDAATLARFGELVAQAARPIDDVRGSAAYRCHALEVLGRRTLGWAWDDFRRGDGCA